MKFFIYTLLSLSVFHLYSTANIDASAGEHRIKRQLGGLGGLGGGNLGQEFGRINQRFTGGLQNIRKQLGGGVQQSFGRLSQGLGGQGGSRRRPSRRGGAGRGGSPFGSLFG